MPVKLTQKQAEEKVKKYNKEYELISNYVNQKEKVTLRHSCGTEYQCTFKTFFEGKNQCPKCKTKKESKSTKKITEEVLVERLKKQVGEEYTYISGFTNMANKTSVFRHNTCGKEFLVAPKMFLGVKQTRCPYCSNKNRGAYLRDENYLQNILKKVSDGKDYKWLEKYNYDNKEKLEILHLTCNRSYKVRPNDFQQGYRCPYCAEEAKESKGVSKIKEILQENNVKYEIEKTYNNLKYKDNLKIDFTIGNILIEYDGSQHFSEKLSFSKESYEKTKIRDSYKNEWIKNNEYIFIRIPYDIKLDDLNFIIRSIIFNSLNEEIINKYNLYYYNPNKQIVLNEESYYTRINNNYFNE